MKIDIWNADGSIFARDTTLEDAIPDADVFERLAAENCIKETGIYEIGGGAGPRFILTRSKREVARATTVQRMAADILRATGRK